MVDLENGVFAGPNAGLGANTANTGNLAYLTGVLSKCDCTANFVIKGASLPVAAWTTWYSTSLPTGYAPMLMEGGLSLGEGGDGSNAGAGAFVEGVIIGGKTTDAADNAVMANVNAFYSSGSKINTNVPATLGASLLAWWDASDNTTFTFGTSPALQTWKDKSSNAYSATQFTVASQPTVVPSFLNGKSVLSFNQNAPSFLKSTDSDTIFANPFSIYYVFRRA